MIKVRNLRKIYKPSKKVQVHAVNDVSFEIDHGSTVTIVGPSGSGKSTILNILGGLDSQYMGEVMVNDKEVRKYNPNYYRRHVLGTIFQQFYLIPSLTVAENILLPIKFGKQLNKAQTMERLMYLLERVDLKNRANHLPSELSGGQAQRVAIARALMGKPQILLADEPTGNLDSKTGREISKLLFDLNKEEQTTLVIVTHDKKLFKQASESIYLRDGKTVKSL